MASTDDIMALMHGSQKKEETLAEALGLERPQVEVKEEPIGVFNSFTRPFFGSGGDIEDPLSRTIARHKYISKIPFARFSYRIIKAQGLQRAIGQLEYNAQGKEIQRQFDEGEIPEEEAKKQMRDLEQPVAYTDKRGKEVRAYRPSVWQKVDTKEHRAVLAEHFSAIDERIRRGTSIPFEALEVISDMPAWMTEFAVAGGFLKSVFPALATAGTVAEKASILRKISVGALKLGARGVGRTALTPQSVIAERLESGLPDYVSFDEDGNMNVEGEETDKPATAWIKAIGRVAFENLTEEAGEVIFAPILGKIAKKLGVDKVHKALEKAWITGGKGRTTATFMEKLIKEGGYDGIVPELGEEYLGKILNAVFGTETSHEGDTRTWLNKVKASVKLTPRELAVQTLAFAPLTILGSGGGALRSMKTKLARVKALKEALPNTSDKNVVAALDAFDVESTGVRDEFHTTFHEKVVPAMTDEEYDRSLRPFIDQASIVWGVNNERAPGEWFDATIEDIRRVEDPQEALAILEASGVITPEKAGSILRGLREGQEVISGEQVEDVVQTLSPELSEGLGEVKKVIERRAAEPIEWSRPLNEELVQKIKSSSEETTSDNLTGGGFVFTDGSVYSVESHGEKVMEVLGRTGTAEKPWSEESYDEALADARVARTRDNPTGEEGTLGIDIYGPLEPSQAKSLEKIALGKKVTVTLISSGTLASRSTFLEDPSKRNLIEFSRLPMLLKYQRGLGQRLSEEGQKLEALAPEAEGKVPFGGLVVPTGQGKWILYAFEKSNVSTALHELMHIWEKQLPIKSVKILKEAGLNSEDIARAFERWARTGTAPTEELEVAFKDFKKWMTEIYPTVKDSPLDVRITKEVRTVFTSMFSLPEEQAEYTDAETAVPEALGQAIPVDERSEDFVETKNRHRVYSTVIGLADMSQHLERFPTGKKILEVLDSITAMKHLLSGPLTQDVVRAKKGLKHSDLKWLEEGSETTSNFRMMIEGSLEPPNKRLAAWMNVGLRFMDSLGSEAEYSKMYRKGRKGKIERFRRAATPRLPRFFTEDAVFAMEHRGSPVYEKLIETVLKMNPEMNQPSLERKIRKAHEGLRRKPLGSLEEVRKISNMPDWIYVDGVKVNILQTDPYMVYLKSVRDQASRIAHVHYLGQGLVKDVSKGKGRTALNKVAKALGVMPKNSKENLQSNLHDQGYKDDVLDQLNYKELVQLARRSGLKIGVSSGDVVEAIDNLQKIPDLDVSQTVALKNGLKLLQGIPEGLEGVELLDAIKNRIHEDLTDHMKTLREEFRKEGGDPNRVDLMFSLSQGLPYHPVGRNPVLQSLKFAGSLIGTAHVSLAAIPNLTQPLVLIPVYAGWKNLAKALKNWITDPKGTAQKGYEIGAYQQLDLPTTFAQEYTVEGEHTLEQISRAIRNTVSRITLLKWNLQKNNIIAGEAGRLLAIDWKENGIMPSQLWIAKDFGLTEEEITEVQAGNMQPLTEAKISQRMVSKTQFITEERYRQGFLTIHPLLRQVFPYQSYGTGSLRATRKLIEAIPEAIKKKDYKALHIATVRLVHALSNYMGIGIVQTLLRRAITLSKPPDDDERIWDLALQGLINTQFLGPVTRMMFYSNPFSTTTDKWMSGFVPKIKAAFDGLGLVYNTYQKALGGTGVGPKRALPLTTQSKQLLKRHFGFARTGLRWMEKLAYPYQTDYYEVRRATGQFKRDVLKKEETDPWEYPVNSKYFFMREAARRGDSEALLELSREYYRSSKIPIKKAMSGLRSSLLNGRPMNVSSDDMYKLMMSLPKTKVEKYYRTHRRYMDMVDLVAPAPTS